MKYRKKPVVIDATRWWKNGDHPEDFSKDHDGFNENGKLVVVTADMRREKNWEGDVVRYFRRPDVPDTSPCTSSIPCAYTMHDHGWIDTPEGGHTVCPGDWIVTGIQGEHYPCKASIFDATYEPVESPGGTEP